MRAGNSGTEPAAGNGTCGTVDPLSNSFGGNAYSSSYTYTHLGQIWQGPINGGGAQQQYLYCDSTHPHQLSGLYATGSTCSALNTASYSASYAAWGNLKTRVYNTITANLAYDSLDHLTQWNAGSSNQAWYVYDASGQRVLQRSTTSATNLTAYAFGLEEHVYDGSGNKQSDTYYYSLNKRLIGSLSSNGTQFYLTDGLGSVVSTFSNTAGSAAVLGNQLYGPYGNQRYNSGSMGTRKGYTGQYADLTSGLDYYNARYYDPVVGRFVSVDVKEGDPQGLDPYAYVQDNPETKNDPTGLVSSNDPPKKLEDPCGGNLICLAQSDANQGSNEFWILSGKLALLAGAAEVAAFLLEAAAGAVAAIPVVGQALALVLSSAAAVMQTLAGTAVLGGVLASIVAGQFGMQGSKHDVGAWSRSAMDSFKSTIDNTIQIGGYIIQAIVGISSLVKGIITTNVGTILGAKSQTLLRAINGISPVSLGIWGMAQFQGIADGWLGNMYRDLGYA